MKHMGRYPSNWSAIARRVKVKARWRCERCGHRDSPHDHALYGAGKGPCDWFCTHPKDGKQRMLTVHHLDLNKSNIDDWNLAVLCQACHLHIQGVVNMAQDYMGEHSAWMVPHVAGRDAAFVAGTWVLPT